MPLPGEAFVTLFVRLGFLPLAGAVGASAVKLAGFSTFGTVKIEIGLAGVMLLAWAFLWGFGILGGVLIRAAKESGNGGDTPG